MKFQNFSNIKLAAITLTTAAFLLGANQAVQASPSALAAENLDFAAILNMKKTMVETHVSITWDDGRPVVGAKIFDHRNNILLGLTDANGKLLITVLNGTLLRLVEPNYGQQQSLRIVQGKKKNDRELLATTSTSPYSETLTEGWTIR